jgi:hypothetical protein
MAPPTTSTPKLGISLPATGNPDYQATNGEGLLAAAITALETAIFGATKYTAAGAIGIAKGQALLMAGSAAAMTLVAPTAVTHDGLQLTIVALDAYAYTVTTPASAINGAKHIATWTAAIGNNINLIAFNGVWYTDDTPNGVALT